MTFVRSKSQHAQTKQRDPEGKKRLMKSVKGRVSLSPGLSVIEKRWGQDGWKGYALGGLGERKEN